MVDAFTFGPVYLDRIIEATSNKFWIDVIKSTQMLWQSEAVFDKKKKQYVKHLYGYTITSSYLLKGN